MHEHVAGTESLGHLAYGLLVAEIDRELALVVEDRPPGAGLGRPIRFRLPGQSRAISSTPTASSQGG
ncbi:MAG: hypothetical protein WB557_09925 [Solirubrobacteraceae bacterium]